MASSYLDGLSVSDKEHYIKKLTLGNGSVLPDPHDISDDKWMSDVTLLPEIAFADISSYLIEAPTEFTRDKIRAYKSLEAYNFFISGHVQDVYIYKPSSTHYVFLKSKVLPSGAKQNLYDVWVIVNDSGWILSGHCTCMSGMASVCSHVAALLFKLQAACQLDLNKVACTSKLCSWKKSRKRAFPGPLQEISFRRPQKNDLFPDVDASFDGKLIGFSSPDPIRICTLKQHDMLSELKKIAPNAAVLTCVSLDLRSSSKEKDDEDTDTAMENEVNTIPELLTSFFDPFAINYNKTKLSHVSSKFYSNFVASTTIDQCLNLERITRLQSMCNKWMLYRVGRTTSSTCKIAFTLDPSKPAESTIKSIMQYNPPFSTKATKYGKKYESKAFQKYVEQQQRIHKNFVASTSGLCLNTKYLYLGASPDCKTSCNCHGEGLVEIKCPYNFRLGLNGYIDSNNCPIKKNGTIDKKHTYFFQMQLQMIVTETKFCDFFVWTQGKKINDSILLGVDQDERFCQILLNKLSDNFEKILLPELVTRSLDPNNKKEMKLYCYCKRPSFNPMIACDGENCEIEWYHYSCVNLVRTPPQDKKWFCPTCLKKDSKISLD